MKTSELTIKDFNKLTLKEKKKAIQAQNNIIRKRLKRLKDSGYTNTYVERQYTKAGGMKSIKGMTTNQLKSQFSRNTKFINAQTSTVRGYKKMLAKQAENVVNPNYVNLTEDERSSFWDLYNELKDMGVVDNLRAKDLSSSQVQSYVYQFYDSGFDVSDAETIKDLLYSEYNVRTTPLKKF